MSGRDANERVRDGERLDRNQAEAMERSRPLGRGRPSGNSEDSEDSEVWGTPIPLRAYPPPLPFPTDALPDWVRQFVEAVAESTQTPPDMAAMLVLAALATGCGGKLRVRAKNHYEPTNIFSVMVMPSGSRKSAVLMLTKAPIEEYERELAEEIRPEREGALAELRVLEKRLDKFQKKAADSDDPHERAQLVDEVKRVALEVDEARRRVPAMPRLVADDITPEALASLLAAHGRMAVISTEGGLFEIMAGRYAKDGSANFDVYLKGHAGDTVRVDRESRPAEYSERPALTLALTVQPDVLRRLADKPGFRGRGLLARFLYVIPKNMVGWRKVDPPSVPDEVIQAYRRQLRRVLMLPAEDKELQLDYDALRLWLRFSEQTERRLRPDDGDMSSFDDWGSKLPGAVARLAGLLHAAQHERPSETSISADTMTASTRIGEYLIGHARVAFGAMGADPRIEEAEKVLSWINRAGKARFTRRDAHQGLKGSVTFETADTLDGPLDLLETNGFIRAVERGEGSGKRGRSRSQAYEVNPLPSAQYPQNSQNPQRRSPTEDSEHSEHDTGDSPTTTATAVPSSDNGAGGRDGRVGGEGIAVAAQVEGSAVDVPDRPSGHSDAAQRRRGGVP